MATGGQRFRSAPSGPLRGEATAPGDKSISHRLFILGALAEGVLEADGVLEGDDVLRSAAAVSAFGAQIDRLGPGRYRIRGRGGFTAPQGPIDCGNAGTGVRLLMGAAASFPLTCRFDGDASLRRRPMGRVTRPLGLMGARFETAEGDRLPLTLHGGDLDGVDYQLPVPSAQVKSAILLAGLRAKGSTVVTETSATRDHTERMLKSFGAALEVTARPDGARAIGIVPGPLISPHTVQETPGDPSSAAFPLVAALLVPGSQVRLRNVLMNPLRDGLYRTLLDMGADLEIVDARTAAGETTADVIARASALRGVVAPPERAPAMIDEYPILAVAAAFAEGTTVMRGIGEMRVKESDRIRLTVAALRACGVEVEEEEEGLIVHGCGGPPPGGAAILTEGDHRIAMSGLVLGLAARAGVEVDGADMIATSFPTFAALMAGLGGELGPC